jgi:phosphoribosyl 1,2-cyclic phosphate phosphodiesterase
MQVDFDLVWRTPMSKTQIGSRLFFPGSGAADWPPLTVDATLPGPTTYRRSASLVIDNHILIDGGPGICRTLTAFSIDARNLTDMFITHSHDDHYDASQVRCLADWPRPEPLRLWYPAGVPLGLASYNGLELHPLCPGDMASPAGYQVLALAANHPVRSTNEIPLAYLFDNTSCRWLYATDGAWLNARSWRRLCDELPLDGLIIDCTLGEVTGDWRVFEHNSLDMVRQIVTVMRTNRVLVPGARVVLTHLARETHLPHLELVRLVAPEGLTVACDGLALEMIRDL